MIVRTRERTERLERVAQILDLLDQMREVEVREALRRSSSACRRDQA